MRESPFQPRRSATLVLVIVNAAIYLLQEVLFRAAPDFMAAYYGYLPLSLRGLGHGYVWQLLSYQFLHSHVDILHVIFNCMAIYMFRLEVESALGRKNFLKLYFLSGVIGGLCQALAGVASYRFAGPVVGASAAAFGLVAAYAVLFPDRILLLFMIIPIRAKYLLLGSAILAGVGILTSASAGLSNGPRIADVAHLGGMVTGFLFIRYALHWNWHWPQLNRKRPRPAQLVRAGSTNAAAWGRAKGNQEELPPEEFLSKEVDPILDKISAHGIQSLTHRERRILEAAREKMGKH